METFLSVISSEIAIVIYLSIAIIAALFFIVKFQKKNKKYKKEIEEHAIKSREDSLDKVLVNEKRGENQ